MVERKNILGGLMLNKKLALKIINKLPLTKEQKEKVRQGVLEELNSLKNFNHKELQNKLQEIKD